MISRTMTGERDSDFRTVKLAALDSFCDFDFAVARQQRDRSHFAQVHANGIVGLFERAGSQIQFDAVFGLLAFEFLFAGNLVERGKALVFGIDDFDAGGSEGGKQVVQIFGRSADFRRQKVADLVVKEVALLLADID